MSCGWLFYVYHVVEPILGVMSSYYLGFFFLFVDLVHPCMFDPLSFLQYLPKFDFPHCLWNLVQVLLEGKTQVKVLLFFHQGLYNLKYCHHCHFHSVLRTLSSANLQIFISCSLESSPNSQTSHF